MGCFHEVIVEGFDCDSTCPCASCKRQRKFIIVIPGWSEGPDPECDCTRESDSGFDAAHRPGMTGGKELDAATYAILLAGALAGGFVSGLAGFGTALMALGIWLYILPPAHCRAAGPDLFGQFADLDAAVDVAAARLQAGLAVRRRRAGRHADRGAAGRARRPAELQAERRRDAAGVSDRALFHPQADGVSLRRPAGRRRRRICRRHPRRPRRPVRPASDPVGERARLDQGSAARRIPDLQRHRARRRAVPADRQRFRRSRTSSGWRCWRCRER